MKHVKELVLQALEEIDGCCDYCRCAMKNESDSTLHKLYSDLASTEMQHAQRLISAAEEKAAECENGWMQEAWEMLASVVGERMAIAKAMLESV